MAFELLFDTQARVLLIRFGSRLTPALLADMQATARRFVASNGSCRGIIDFSAVAEVDLPSGFLASLARQKPVLAGHRRVIVAPSELVYGLTRMFGTQQDAAIGEAPEVVRSLQEAYDALGL